MFRKVKIIIKKVIYLIVISYICFSINVFSNAAQTGDELISEFKSDMDTFKSNAEDITIDDATGPFKALGQLLTMVGAGVMVAVTIYMGIKYLTGGPEAQGKLKTQLIGLVVSGIVIFGSYSIWKMVITLAATFDN